MTRGQMIAWLSATTLSAHMYMYNFIYNMKESDIRYTVYLNSATTCARSNYCTMQPPASNIRSLYTSGACKPASEPQGEPPGGERRKGIAVGIAIAE